MGRGLKWSLDLRVAWIWAMGLADERIATVGAEMGEGAKKGVARYRGSGMTLVGTREFERVLGELPSDLRPKCPVCVSSLFFSNGRWLCKSCPYRGKENELEKSKHV